MKNLLVVCDQPHIDVALRRSLAHLAGSCHVQLAADGYQALEALNSNTAFDLIIINSHLHAMDSFELIESIEYIDPGLTIILMLEPEHKTLWSLARHLGANPILRPFKPLTFLRLIDTLLYEQLERYRDLADTIIAILNQLCQSSGVMPAFMVDDSGSILMSNSQADPDSLARLGRLVSQNLTSPDSPPEASLSPADQDHTLHLAPITEGLYLALLAPLNRSPDLVATHFETAMQKLKAAFYVNTLTEQTILPNLVTAGSPSLTIPLKITSIPSEPPPQPEADEQFAGAINWQFITESPPAVLQRLQEFCQIN